MSARLDAALVELAEAIRAELAEATHAHGPDRLLSIPEAAGALGVSRSTAYAELQAGRLRSVKVGRRRLVPSSAVGDRIGGGTPLRAVRAPEPAAAGAPPKQEKSR